jgi:hypothetical protein
MFPELQNILDGGQADMSALARINEALRANRRRALEAMSLQKGGIGYQTPSQPSSEEFSALVPQSIEEEYSIATATQEDLVFAKDVPNIPVGQNIHQWNALTAYQAGGPGALGFTAEGGLPSESSSSFTQGAVTIKYLINYRTVTQQAMTVGLLGPQRNALAAQMDLGTKALALQNEWAMLHADSDVVPLAYDGIVTQLRNYGKGSNNWGTNVTDNRGAVTTLSQLSNTIGRLQSTDAFAKPNVVYVDPASFTPLSTEASDFARYMADRGDTSFAQGIMPDRFYFMGPRGKVMVKACPFLDTSIWGQPTAAVGASPPSKPTVSGVTTPVNAASLFGAGDAGTYRYSLIAITASGQQSVPTESADIAGVAVAAGDSVNIAISDAAAKAASDPVVGYILYRGALDGAFSTIKEIARVPVNANGAGGTTLLIDLNVNLYNTGKILLTRQDPKELCYHQLLDTTYIPLARINLADRFALLRFGTPTLKLPQRSWLIENVGKPTFAP